MDECWYIENPKSNIAVGSIQMYLDKYLANNKGKIDYIHGEDVTKNLASKMVMLVLYLIEWKE